jgi:phage terminase Nu1 subunit (DNA packaging protein)
MASYSVDTIAKLLLLDPRRIQQLVKEGILPKKSRGKYDLEKCVQGYVRYQRELAKGKNPARVEDDDKKAKEDRLLKEFKRKELDGTLVNAEDMDFLLEDLFISIKTRIREATTKGAQEITSKLGGDRKMQAKVEKILKTEHDDGVLTELAQWKPTQKKEG